MNRTLAMSKAENENDVSSKKVSAGTRADAKDRRTDAFRSFALAVAEPGLFFGVSGNGGLPEVEPLRFGKIVFSARLAVGEPVEILSEDGEAVIAAGVVVGNEGVMAADTGDAPPTYEIKFAKQSGAEAIESFPLHRLRHQRRRLHHHRSSSTGRLLDLPRV